MPSLRGLLALSILSGDTYDLLEALVDELEAQRPPEVDARIVALTADRDSWERRCRHAEYGLAENRATMDSLQTGRTYWEKRCLEAEHLVSTLHNNADREVGRLVRKMRVGTRLVCGIGRGSQNIYMTAEMRADRPPNLDPWVWLPGFWADPAEALRSIQEGADEQAAEA